jgi:hypothetical protein
MMAAASNPTPRPANVAPRRYGLFRGKRVRAEPFKAMREDLEEARAGLLAKPGDERLAKQVAALEGLLKGVLAKVERLRKRCT